MLGKIITGTPEAVTQHRKTVPLNVEATVNKALEKVPADRFSGAAEFARALAEPAFRHGDGAVAGVATAQGSWNRLSIGFAGFAAVLSLALGW